VLALGGHLLRVLCTKGKKLVPGRDKLSRSLARIWRRWEAYSHLRRMIPRQTPSSLSSKKTKWKTQESSPKQKKPVFQLQSKTKQTKPDQTNNHQKKRTQEKRNHPLPRLTADNKLPPLDHLLQRRHHTQIMQLNGRSEQLRTIHNTGRKFLWDEMMKWLQRNRSRW
jgi:hypothetical protein